jgi:hypothetical protein
VGDGLGPGAAALHLQHDAATREEEVGEAGGLAAIHFCGGDSKQIQIQIQILFIRQLQ